MDFDDVKELSGQDQLETLQALFQEFESQVDPENGDESAFVAQMQGAFFEALGETSDMFTLQEGQDGTGFGTLDDVFEGVRLSLLQVVEEFRGSIDVGAYQNRLDAAVLGADWSADADLADGLGTFEAELDGAAFPNVASTPPDYTSDPGGGDWAARLDSATFDITADSDNDGTDDQTDVEYLDAAFSLSIVSQGSTGVHTGDILGFFQGAGGDIFLKALGDGTLDRAEVEARIERAFADVEVTLVRVDGDPPMTFNLADTGTGNPVPTLDDQVKETLLAHYDAVNAAYTADKALTDFAFLNAAEEVLINGSNRTGDVLSFFTDDADAFFRSILIGGTDDLYDKSYDALIDDYLARFEPAGTNLIDIRTGEEFLGNTTYKSYVLDADTVAVIGDAVRAQYRAVMAEQDLGPVQQMVVQDIRDTAGAPLITYSDGVDGSVEVEVMLPDMETLLGQIDRDPALRAILPIDFDFTNVASKLNFRISTVATIDDKGTPDNRSDDTATQALMIDDIAFTSNDVAADDGAIFAFGKGAADGLGGTAPASTSYPASGAPGALASTAVGFLEGTLIGIETAQIDLVVQDAALLDAIRFDSVASYDFASDAISSARDIGAGDVDDLAFQLRVRALGDTGFSNYDANSDAMFDLARYKFELDLPLSLEDTDAFSFEASLIQQVRLDFAGFAGTEPDLSPPATDLDPDTNPDVPVSTTPPIFVDFGSPLPQAYTNVRFQIDNDAAVPEALRPAFHQMANAVWSLETDFITEFLIGMSDGVSGALENANFDLGIPLTDFDILDGFDAIAELLKSIPDIFRATPQDFGFASATGTGSLGTPTDMRFGDYSVEAYVEVASDNLVKTGNLLTDEQISALQALGTVTFTDYTQDGGSYDRTNVAVDFAAVKGLPTVSSDPADPPPMFDPQLYLDNLVIAMNTAFTGAGLQIVAGRTGGALTFTQDAAAVDSLFTVADIAIWSELGFNTTHTESRDLTVTGAAAPVEDLEVFEFYAGKADVDLETLDTLVLAGFDSVRFQISEGDIQHVVDVQRPALGWADGGDTLDNFIAAFNAALDAKSIDIEVSRNLADGLRFNVDTNTDGRYAIAIDSSSLDRANSLSGVMSWMQQTVRDLDLMPAFTFEVDLLTGEFLMDFDPIEASTTVEAGLSIDDTRLGDLENVDLQAELSGTLSSRLDLAAGFNIFDMQAAFAESGSVQEAVFDNTYLSDLKMNAVLDAQATEIDADVEWGMLRLSLGENAIENFIKLNVELDATLVGQSDAVFSNRISATQLDNLGRDLGPGSDLTDLLGRFDVTGGIVVDAEGCPVLIGTDTDATIDRLVIQNGEDRLPDTDYAMLMINLSAIEFDLGGVGANLLPEPIAVMVGNLFDPLNTTHLCTDFDACATLVDPGMILDGMIALADMLDAFENNLATYLPVLNLDLPMLSGNSILSQFSFAGGFRDALIELRGEDFGFDDINGLFDDVFGEGNVSINLVTEALDAAGTALENVCELFFEIDLDFLEDFFIDIPFNLDLNQLLGSDGLGSLLGSSGSDEAADALADVLTNLVDAKADARLRLDPLLGLNLTLGLDLKALAGTKVSLTDAEGTTQIDDLLSVNALSTNVEAGANDLRIDWRNLDTGDTQAFQLDVNALGAGDLPTLEELRTAIQAQFDTNTDNDVQVALETAADGTLRLTFTDPDSTARDDTDRDALFADTSLAGADFTQLNDVYTPRDLGLGVPADAGAAFDFDLTLGDPAQTFVLSVAAEAGRDLVGLVQAMNLGLNELSISVDLLDGADTGTETVVLLQLFAFDLDDDGELRLQTAPYTNGQGWDEFALDVTEQTGLVAAGTLADSGFVALETYTPRILNIDTLIKSADGIDFAISVNGSTPIEISITDDLSAATDEEVIAALNAALHAAQVSRGDLSDTAVIGTTTSLSQVLRFEKIDAPEPGDSTFQLRTTNFVYQNGYDEIAVELLGSDISEKVEFTVTSVDDSNLALALGFASGQAVEVNLTGGLLKILDATVTTPDAPIAFVLTDDYVVANAAFDEATATGTGFDRIDAAGETELRTISSSNISAELSLGVPDGLNIVLALGPAEAEIIGGEAFIGRSGGEDRGYIRGVVEDADGTDDGRYNIVDIYERAVSDDPKFLELFGLDVDFETRIELPFSGAFGLLDPEKHGFAMQSTLLRTNGGDATGNENDNSVSAAALKATFDAALAGLDPMATGADQAVAVSKALLENHFVGDARQLGLAALNFDDPITAAGFIDELSDYTFVDFKDIASNGFGDRDIKGDLPDGYYDAAGQAYGPHSMALSLPTIGLFDCGGILDLINSPLTMLNGLDMIMSTIDGFVSDFMADVDLPVVGDNLAVGAGFFRDIRFDVFDPAREFLETPRADGSLPTTIDLINDFLNGALNDIVNFRAIDLTDTAGDRSLIAIDQLGDDEVIYGALSFGIEIFDAVLPIEFALDIPGIDLNVESATDMRLTTRLDIALGFGLDCDGGFFLLNSTDNGEEEVRLQFEATLLDRATGPEFQMSIGGALSVNAELESAIEPDGNQNVAGGQLSRLIDSADNRNGATVSLGIDLFGESGTANGDLDSGAGRVYDFTQSNLAALLADSINDRGTPSTADDVAFLTADLFDRTVYISQLNFSDFAEFTFNANVDAHIDLEVKFDGAVGFVPSIYTDFIFSAYVPEATFGPNGLDITKDLNITRLEFRDIHLDLTDLAKALGQVLNPIKAIVDPIADVFNTLGSATPISYAIGAINTVFPVVNIANQINGLIGPGGILDTSSAGGYGGTSNYLCIGTMDFLGARGETPLTQYTINQALFTPCIDFQYGFDFNFASSFKGPGMFIEIPILQDPTQALNLLMGKFEKVEIVEVNFNLLEADIKANVAASILGSIGLPGWAAGAIRGGFHAEIDIYFKAGMTMGYDLSGLINFANTLDPERLLDGVYIESQPGALIDGTIRASMGLNAGIARASGGITADLQATFVDPNRDGKLRLPELLDRVDAAGTEFAAGDIGGALEELFTGQFKVDFFLDFWAGINLPWPLPDLGWGFGINENILNFEFGNNAVGQSIALDSNGVSYLNVGAAAGKNLSSMSKDGNDTISFNGLQVNYNSNGQNFTGPRTLSGGTGGVVANLGEGKNSIDYTDLTAVGSTLTYAGAGNDTIVLPTSGTHVVFAGDGIDRITGGGNGTYYIFAEGGADSIDVSSGTSGRVVVFTGDDYDMRELFLSTFKAESGATVSATAIENLMTGASGVLNGGYFANGFTAGSQLSENNDVETVILTGSGTKQVHSGKGADFIKSTGGGVTRVYSGAGDDQIVIENGGTNFVEAGAGRDQVNFSGNGTNTAFGWAAALMANEELARLDGDDILIGGGGVDIFDGQFGNDIIAGFAGNDILSGGLGNDLISGGELVLTPIDADGEATGPAVVLSSPTALKDLQSKLRLTTLSVANDGADTIRGGAGKDVLIGGSGNDVIEGGGDADLLIGDFGIVNVSSTRIAETFISSEITSGLGGLDVLDGGVGGDIIAAGGAGGLDVVETITDLFGNNIVFGDFGIVQGARILESPTAFSAIPSLAGAATFGTRDNITTGAGNDIIFGGELGDTITSGTGGDFIFGDLGSFVPSKGTLTNDVYDPATGEYVRNNFLTEGDDVINIGQANAADLFDLVIGGGGTDTVTSENGGLVFVGDYGFVQLNPAGVKALLALKDTSTVGKSAAETAQIKAELLKIERMVQSLKTVDIDDQGTDDPTDDVVTRIYGELDGLPAADQRFGDDVLTTNSGGNVFAVLGGGSDTAILADGLSYIVADDGTLGVEFVSVDADGNPVYADDVPLDADGSPLNSAGALILFDGDGVPVDLAGEPIPKTSADYPTTVSFGLITGRSISTVYAGNDTVTSADGRDVILMGDGDDSVVAGAGLNIVLMDNGLLSASDDAYAYPTVLTSVAGLGDGNDDYTGGADADIVVLGGGGTPAPDGFTDRAELGAGTNYAMGDSGQITVDLNSELGTNGLPLDILIVELRSDALSVDLNDGADLITAGMGDDFVILGLGADETRLGSGAAFGMGSSGTINVTKRSIETLLDVSIASYDAVAGVYDGDDRFENGEGQEYILLGLGNDRAELGNGEAFVVGSEGDINVQLNADTSRSIAMNSQIILPGQLAAIPPQTDGDDYVSTGDGNDFLVLGLGADEVSLGNGNMHVQASEGGLSFVQDVNGYIDLAITSRAPVLGAIDGAETITGLSGDDFVVLGLGADRADMGDGATYVVGGEGDLSYTTTATGTDLRMKSAAILAGQLDDGDSITSGVGDDAIILGLGADTLNSGTGDLRVLGGAGELTRVTTAQSESLRMKSAEILPGSGDTADSVTNGDGAKYAILGLGGDTGTFGDGAAHVIGGEGEIRFDRAASGATDLFMESQAFVAGNEDGDDTVTSAEGDDFVILGLGSDVADVGNGLNRVAGDQARIEFLSGRTETILSLTPDRGGNDTVTTGADADVVILGQGSDQVATNGGADLVVGDNGEIDKNYADNLHRVRALTDNFGAADVIETGDGNDLIIAAYGDDTVETGAGEDFALGDLGDIGFRNFTDVETLTYLQRTTGGNDQITASGVGDNILIGQAGEDLLTGSITDDLLIGDLGELRFYSILGVLPEQSTVDRMTLLEFSGTSLIYDDVLIGNDGSDFLLGGYGSDELLGGNGQDFLFGDTIVINRTYDALTGFEFMSQETNFAFDFGGYDRLVGGLGPDVLIGGLGPDLFVGDTEGDLLYGDSVALEFELTFAFTDNPTPKRPMTKVNFAGSSPVDLVSNSQTLTSTGVFLSTNKMESVFEEIGYAILDMTDDEKEQTRADLPRSLGLVEAFLAQDEVVADIAESIFLLMARAEMMDCMTENFQTYLTSLGIPVGSVDVKLLQYLLEQVIDDNTLQLPDSCGPILN